MLMTTNLFPPTPRYWILCFQLLLLATNQSHQLNSHPLRVSSLNPKVLEVSRACPATFSMLSLTGSSLAATVDQLTNLHPKRRLKTKHRKLGLLHCPLQERLVPWLGRQALLWLRRRAYLCHNGQLSLSHNNSLGSIFPSRLDVLGLRGFPFPNSTNNQGLGCLLRQVFLSCPTPSRQGLPHPSSQGFPYPSS